MDTMSYVTPALSLHHAIRRQLKFHADAGVGGVGVRPVGVGAKLDFAPLGDDVGVAVAGDKQHGNTGESIRWAREKSKDQLNTAFRHLFDYGMAQKLDTDGQRHLSKTIWRL